MSTVHKSRKKIINMIEIGIGICVFICLFLFGKQKYWAPEKGEYGTRKISRIEIFISNPNELWKYIIILIGVGLFIIVFLFLKKRFIKDWFK